LFLVKEIMNMKKLNVTLAILVAAVMAGNAQTSVNSEAVGYVTTTIAAGPGGGVAKVTPISPVLLELTSNAGVNTGVISGVASSSITVASAGWTAGALSSSQGYIMITSGLQNGLILRITSNTADTATFDTFGLNIATAGVAVGDSFKIVVGETLLSMFGNPSNGVVGGTSTQFGTRTIDTVVARDATGSLRTFYFDTGSNTWKRSGSGSDQGNTPIAPNSGALYYRVGTTPLSYVQTGVVPSSQMKCIIPAGGSVFLGRFFPTDGTIANYGLNSLSGWNNTSQVGVTTASVDKLVTVDNSTGAVRSYYYNGTRWLRSGSSTAQDSVAVPAGGAAYTVRNGTGSASILTVPAPYSL
jgi:uncharacterized protein (TIGR02597 family)